MTMKSARKYGHEAWLIAAGLMGLGVAAFASCGDDSAEGTGGSGSGGGDSTGASDTSSATGSTVDADACSGDAQDAEHVATVVDSTNALLAVLSDDEKTAIQYDLTLENAQQWSNFPTTFVERNGVRIGDMSEDAQALAEDLVGVAAGDDGATLFEELRAADEWLVTDGNAASSDYGRGLYYFSVHGTPSATAPWMLQIGGHHLAYNFLYNATCLGATPLFDGAEPMDWVDAGVTHSPLAQQRSTMAALVGSVSSSADALLAGSFGDLVNGPAGGGPGGGSGGDTKYPSSLSYPTGTTGRGVLVSSLSEDQQQLVKNAIEAWVTNVADPVATSYLAAYESDAALAETYVGYAGSSDLSTQGSYARIDGPRVWIEVTVQGGIVYRDVVHFHTIWRDKAADYGAELAQ